NTPVNGSASSILLADPLTGVFETPVSDFKLSQLSLPAGATTTLYGDAPQLLLCMQGAVEAVAGERTVMLKPGQPAALLLPGVTAKIVATADALLFCATEGIHNR
ncbi:MAG: hypothetical protein ACKOA3_05930, partial [Sphingomonadales bacterium]